MTRLRSFRFALFLLSCVAWEAGTAFGQASTPSNSAGGPSPTYDIVSIKPANTKGPYSGWWRWNPDGFSANTTVPNYVTSAYNLIMDNQISGLPEWANTTQFEIEAKLDPERVKAHKALSREERLKQDSVMLQALLADRFHLRVHHELKQLPVYELVVAKGGAKLKESPANAPPGYPVSSGRINGHRIETANLARSLSGATGRIIIDKTGLTGKYDIDLNWSSAESPETTDSGPSIFTALQEQLGLKLEPSKADVDTIVVDHIDKPTAN